MQIVKTLQGFRIYGNFGSMMDVSETGEVIYCNMVDDSSEYKRMVKFYKANK